MPWNIRQNINEPIRLLVKSYTSVLRDKLYTHRHTHVCKYIQWDLTQITFPNRQLKYIVQESEKNITEVKVAYIFGGERIIIRKKHMIAKAGHKGKFIALNGYPRKEEIINQ